MYSRAYANAKHEYHLVSNMSIAPCDRSCLKRADREAGRLYFRTVCSVKFSGSRVGTVSPRAAPNRRSREAKETKRILLSLPYLQYRYRRRHNSNHNRNSLTNQYKNLQLPKIHKESQFAIANTKHQHFINPYSEIYN